MQNIEIYYESIKQVYDQIIEWENRPKPFRQRLGSFIIGFGITIFVLSLIPIIPSILIYLGSQFGWHIGTIDLSQSTIQTYALGWLLGTILSALIMFGSIKLEDIVNPIISDDKRETPQSLSEDQLTFIFIYGAYKELKVFFVSHINENVNKAQILLEELIHIHSFYKDELIVQGRIPSHEPEVIYPKYTRYSRKQPSYTYQVSIARSFLRSFGNKPWFKIEEQSETRLLALISFLDKILIRIHRMEDLPAVIAILEKFSKFLYAFLPEHQINMEADKLANLHAEGIKILDEFVQSVNQLVEIPTDTKPTKKDRTSDSVFFQKLHTLYIGNILFRFIIWFILLLVIISGLVLLLSIKIPNLDVNIMISMIIATSVTGAAGLAVFSSKVPGRDKNFQDNGKNQDGTKPVNTNPS